ncbi:PREDICTED: ejaculatory bulb-specific protein 3-like [Dinoponera quadriceps]|uniref:Ejaculatory bulb-specific protein 3-like n=1 Tax=Dinoponera quadriceps TaxID=609295 RepID=A0A6P3Y2I3_DINQU|nr:PREDICTED: ejaculatory bulb-specific protein 3-like [Dinoponera quadriceps]
MSNVLNDPSVCSAKGTAATAFANNRRCPAIITVCAFAYIRTIVLQVLLLILVCAVLAATMPAEPDEGQTGRSRISDEQLNMALSDKRYLTRQLKCALGEAPCDPVGRRLKSLAPLVLRGSCPQCSNEETRQIKKVLSHIQRSFPKEWNRIVQQYAGVS